MRKKLLLAMGVILIGGYLAAGAFLRAIYVVPILMYHSIDTKSDATNRLLVVSPASFRRQMEFLKRHAYRVIPLDELVGLMRAGKPIPPKAVCVTFDEGYENNYSQAYPVLKELGFPATIFVVTGSIGHPGYVSEPQIREMASRGVVIGSHTRTHYWLGGGDLKRARDEIAGSADDVRRVSGREKSFFCYPVGTFTPAVRQLVIDTGYLGAVATNPGAAYPNNDLFALKRLRISHQCDNLLVFWFETTGIYTWIKERTHRRHHRAPTAVVTGATT